MFDKIESLKVKGIAILLLLFHHLFYNLDRVNSSGMKYILFTKENVSIVAVMARICVWLFAFVSVYGLTLQYENKKESVGHFIARRWVALMKSYWFVYVLVVVFTIIGDADAINVYEGNGLYVVLDFMGWADFFGTPTLQGGWWYMCFAQILLILIPVFSSICKKFGYVSVLIGFVGLQYTGDGIGSIYGGKYSNYFLVAILAVLCVQNKFLDKMLARPRTKTAKYMLVISAFLLMAFKYELSRVDEWQLGSLINAVVSLLICWFTCCYIKRDGRFGNALKFLGEHSGNIFLIHTVYITRYSQVIYWSKNPAISFCTLLVISILSSIFCEYIKKKIQYSNWIDKIFALVLDRV